MAPPTDDVENPWSKHLMATEEVSERLKRVCMALSDARVPFALVGGQAVALWVATKDPVAVRTTKDVDIKTLNKSRFSS
ncbi:MAG TPA: hypothetical protein VJL29_02205 [Thermoguttaceae bacterium]|nr:hypothetical protein [Thermoguttaceae bacterium]